MIPELWWETDPPDENVEIECPNFLYVDQSVVTFSSLKILIMICMNAPSSHN